jgi:hypothetical protein
LLLSARPAVAEEWYEAYQAGVAALKRGDHARAAERLGRAIALRPEPGRNVVTYGTNFEARYYPYLYLAEACLALGRLEKAREALEASATWAREPAGDRQKLQAQLEAALPRQPSASAAAPTPPAPIPSAVPPLETPIPSPATSASPASSPLPAAPTPVEVPASHAPKPPSPPLPRDAGTAAGTPRASTPPSTAPAEEPNTGTLVIVSRPPGASAYLDDEPLGSTDPVTGRIVKTLVTAGRHRVRVSAVGHEDSVREIDVPRGGSTVFPATLTPHAAPAFERAGLLAFVAVALALAAVVAWIMLRRPGGAPSSIAATPRPGTLEGGAVTPPGPVTPGARRDSLGREWFGEYRLLELLGRGGMASVYKAERRGERVALKRPLASFLDDPDFLQRFTREVEISRSMNHPNIVRILERGEVEQVPYFTMELLAGESLQAFIRRGAADPRAAASIVAQVAEALDFAHSKGVVHRDLKPSNIMLLPDRTAKVMDFGIARAGRFEGLTLTGAFLGTPDYVAPETIEGRGAGPSSDLYSLGVVFYELLVGQALFRGETPFAVLRKHSGEEPPPPSSIEKAIPAELDAIVLRLLRKSPDERPASAEELVVSLREWLNRAA